ncbi:MAG: methyltransferase domain-containing protein [Thermoplasmata archaeon]|nr:methyltransferase domain-containing protein [Candidatus Sysuiplasma acidicola]MBX8645201.1 methyltransferase domain-containing protein [Candidatus Sysuiplasma acidicola]MDH2905011.1 class I SAM-dependent methyltransferase [Methanomassiliicoccales archaeon]
MDWNRTTENRAHVASRWKALYSAGMNIGGCPLSDFSSRMIVRYCKQGSRLLDAGCGTGRSMRHLLAMPELRENAIEVMGLDFCMDALLSHNDSIIRICGDMLNMPFIPGCFDIVTSRQVLDGYSAREISLFSASCLSVLREGGILIIDARGPFDTRARSAAFGKEDTEGHRSSYFSRPELIEFFAPFSAVDWEEDFRCRKTPSGKRLITHNISLLFRKGKVQH